MIENIYLDMDGVLCDFANEAAEKKYLNLKTRKVNWRLLNTEGEKFWENLKWIDEGKKLYKYLYKYCLGHDINLCILSSIGNEKGRNGKKTWIKNNLKINPLNIYFVVHGADKAKYAVENSVLIDDYGKNVDIFIRSGGNAIKFKNDAKEVINKLEEILTEDY